MRRASLPRAVRQSTQGRPVLAAARRRVAENAMLGWLNRCGWREGAASSPSSRVPVNVPVPCPRPLEAPERVCPESEQRSPRATPALAQASCREATLKSSGGNIGPSPATPMLAGAKARQVRREPKVLAAKARRVELPSKLLAGKARVVDLPSKLLAGKARVVDLPSKLLAVKARVVELPSKLLAGKARVVELPSNSGGFPLR